MSTIKTPIFRSLFKRQFIYFLIWNFILYHVASSILISQLSRGSLAQKGLYPLEWHLLPSLVSYMLQVSHGGGLAFAQQPSVFFAGGLGFFRCGPQAKCNRQQLISSYFYSKNLVLKQMPNAKVIILIFILKKTNAKERYFTCVLALP